MNKEPNEHQSDHLAAGVGGYAVAVGGGNKPPEGKLTDSPSSGEKPKVKRKRKSPAVPWKKPKDMPKRPLSAYNLFFKDERERLLSQRKSEAGSDSSKKSKRAGGGIGFANLAKTIAAKWNDLDPESRAPYEEIAAKEKARYDSAVAKWRIEQKEKAAKAKALAEEEEKTSRKNDSAADKLLEGYPGIEGGAYPHQWFQAGMEHHQGEGEAGGVPSFVDAMGDDSSRSYVSPMSHDSSRRRMRQSSGSHSAVSSLSPNSSATARTPPYYAHSPHYSQQDPYMRDPRVRGGYRSRRMDPYATAASLHMSSTMRDPRSGRSASMPHAARGGQHLSGDMDRIQMEVADLRRARGNFFGEGGETGSYPSSSYGAGPSSQAHSAPPAMGSHHPGHSQVHPRSASLPGALMGSSSRPGSGNGGAPLSLNPSPQPTGNPGADDSSDRARRSSRRSPTEPNEEAVFEASLRSLSENLDDDAISFLTTMRFE